MDISLDVVQELAPDQASLSAAKKLLKPSAWPVRGQAQSVNTIWGQCQGSGANPYYVMADVVDHGYKCTCPSRKFPCKHTLALMWQFAACPSDFAAAEPPDWVHDWLGRRRKANKSEASEDVAPKTKKNIHFAAEEATVEASAEEQAKKDAANAKRAEKQKATTAAAITDGLNDLEQWIADQLRTGMGDFIKQASARCRQMAARLVDAKATNLASRLDELPSKLFNVSVNRQPEWAMRELGQLVLLCEAWHANCEAPDTRRCIATTENREQLINSTDALRVTGVWENLGEKVFTRRDGLVSHATWLLQVDAATPRFALLQDYYPAAVGKRQLGMSIGGRINATIIYYPSQSPLRAIIYEHSTQENGDDFHWPPCHLSAWQQFAACLNVLPWLEEAPCLLAAGRIMLDSKQHYWWQSADLTQVIALTNESINPLLLGCESHMAFVINNGERCELLSAQTSAWGVIMC